MKEQDFEITEADIITTDDHTYPIWGQESFINCFSEALGYKSREILITKKGNILCRYRFFIKNLLFTKHIVQIPLYYYYYLHFEPTERERENKTQLQQLEITELLAKYIKEKYTTINMNLYYTQFDVRGFMWNQLTARPLYTYIIDTKKHNSKEYFPQVSSRIRKVQDIVTSNDIFYPEVFWELHDTTYKRQNKKHAVGRKECLDLLARLYSLQYLQQVNIVHDSRIIDSHLLLNDNIALWSYHWQSGKHPDYLKLGVDSFSIDTKINIKKRDFNYIDMCGANIKKIACFKAGFAGDLHVYYKIQKGVI